MILIWDDANIEHIARHGVSTDEVEFAVKHPLPRFPQAIEDGKFLIWGRTLTGRYLQVIFVFLDEGQLDWDKLKSLDKIGYVYEDEEIARVIHSRELTGAEKHRIRRSRNQK